MKDITVQVYKEPGFEDLPIPAYQSEGAAGVDLHAAVESPVDLRPGEFKRVSTGIRIAIPEGFEGQVRPRSGLAGKHGIGVVNSPGTIDSDYRGTVGVILINLGSGIFRITRGMRIAQLVFAPVQKALLVSSQELPESKRNTGGFGSTG
ncbi:dUTP diphosphatase [bacterium]|nr:dUTP diphosphatase [bacterium]